MLVGGHANSTELEDEIAKVHWGQTAEVVKCHARDRDIEKVFLQWSSLKSKWLVHIPALPSLVQVRLTFINPLNTLCFLFIAGQCLSSIFSSGNCVFLLCLDNSCLSVLSHIEVTVSQKPFLATSHSFLCTHFILLWMPFYLPVSLAFV